MTTIAITIPGKPLPKGRPRVVNGRAHTDAKTRAYETMLRAKFAAAAHFDKWTIPPGDVVVDIVLRFGSAVHGDVDNCAKAILDAAQGVLMANDKCVRSLYIEREWATAERPEGITVTVTSSPMEPRPKKPRAKTADGTWLAMGSNLPDMIKAEDERDAAFQQALREDGAGPVVAWRWITADVPMPEVEQGETKGEVEHG